MKENIFEMTAINGKADIGLSQEDRHAVCQALGRLLADEHVLYIKLRNYHWNVTGMQFQPLHALFAEQYTALAVAIDDIAERIRSLGFFAPGSMDAFKAVSRLTETDHLEGNARAMVENLLHDQETIIQILRHDLEKALEKYQDAGTSDFLTGLMEQHEKMAWMLRAHLA